jgi:hypothetical protein
MVLPAVPSAPYPEGPLTEWIPEPTPSVTILKKLKSNIRKPSSQTPEYVTQQGAIEIFDAADHSLGKGKVLIIWKKTGEGWRIFRHMLNFDGRERR